MMLDAAEDGNVEALVYCGIDLCFRPVKKSVLQDLVSRPVEKTSPKGAHKKTSKSRNAINKRKPKQTQLVQPHEKGVYFLEEAVKKKNAEAAFLMGSLLADGNAGLEKNQRLAEENFEKAEEWGLQT